MRQSSQLDRALQRYTREYLASRTSNEIDLEKLVDWILKNKPWEADPKKIKGLLRAEVSHALSEERFTDDDMRRVRKYHFVKRKKGDTQLKLCFPIEHISKKDRSYRCRSDVVVSSREQSR